MLVLKKNKSLIPNEFKLTKHREPHTSLFGFKSMTLLSYVPKRYKNVLLISSLHDDATIDGDTGDRKKPDIITFYNLTKGGVDTVDELFASFNVARNTRRWPLAVFYSMLNIAGINRYIIHSTKNEEKLLRRHYLRQLVHALVKENTARRTQSDKHTRITRFSCEICSKFIYLEHSKHICSDCNDALKCS